MTFLDKIHDKEFLMVCYGISERDNEQKQHKQASTDRYIVLLVLSRVITRPV